MKRYTSFGVLVLLQLLICFGCIGRRDSAEDGRHNASDSLAVDTLPSDSMLDLVEDTPLPKAVDELFDDFFFNFAGNRKMQLSRIQFPLPVEKEGGEVLLDRRQWQYSHFFMGQGYYTVLLDNNQQDTLSKSVTVEHASIEKLYMNENLVKRYVFDRIAGEWMLTSVAHSQLDDHPCASFLHFYEQFATDTTFQMRSLDNFVLMTAPDSDDEFTEVTGTITPEQWSAFKPEVIPSGVIYCVNYGQQYTNGHQKILIVRGIANGLNIEMTFQRKGASWKLVKIAN